MKALAQSLVVVLLLMSTAASWAQEPLTGAALLKEFKRLIEKEDYLSARVLLKSNMNMNVEQAEWREIRNILHKDARTGWDLLRQWDTHPHLRPMKSAVKIDKIVREADILFSKKKYKEAHKRYQWVVSLIKKKNLFKENRYLYYDLVTSMARSLYAMGDHMQAFRYYSWIPALYPRYKQILFERMWASFRAGQVEYALGDLVAQYSPFFGGVINPETFLVQIYTYKKLCLDQDLNQVLLLVEKFRQRLENREFSAQTWASSDWELIPLARLSIQKDFANSKWVTQEEREVERQKILDGLNKKYESDRREYLSNLTKVIAYARMAFDVSSKELSRVRELPDPATLIARRLEMWPVDGPEDWLDEIDHKFFLGKSQCGPDAKDVKIKTPPSPVFFSVLSPSSDFIFR